MDKETTRNCERVLEAIDQLRNRKARPNIARISNYLFRRFNVNSTDAKDHLEWCVENNVVLKVEYKGNISYRNAAKKWAQLGKRKRPQTTHHKTKNELSKLATSRNFMEMLANIFGELVVEEPDYLENGVPPKQIMDNILSKDSVRYTRSYIAILLVNEVEKGNLIKLENGNFLLGPCDEKPKPKRKYKRKVLVQTDSGAAQRVVKPKKKMMIAKKQMQVKKDGPENMDSGEDDKRSEGESRGESRSGRRKMPRSKQGVKRNCPDLAALQAAARSVQNEHVSVRTASKDFKVSRSTLKRYLIKLEQNVPYKSYGNCAVKKVFSEAEEKSLCEYLVTASHMHYGLTRRDLQVLAYDFAKANNRTIPASWENKRRAGKQWYLDFLKRRNTLSLRKPQATSLARSTSFNKHNVSTFFEKLKGVIEKYQFTADKIYNLDESGNTNVHMPDKILACKGVKQVGSATSGERGVNVTIIACVNAIGNSVPPLYIFPRVNYKDFMIKGAPPGSIGSAHPSGWSNKTIFLQYLHHFLGHVNCSSNNKVLLILDNHESHITIEAINFAKENGIVMLTLPPHTSHKLQPLDRSVFGPYKTYYNTACADWMRSHPGKPISIYDMAEISGIAYPLAFTPSNIQSGFRVSGIWPFNKNIFQEHEFMGSSVTDRPYDEPSSSQGAPSSHLAPGFITNIPTTASNIVATSSSIHASTPNAAPSSLNTTPSTQNVTASTSHALISPEMIRPFPQAASRKASAKGRKKGKCRILTDTPEKMEIEGNKKSATKTTKAKKEIVKRKVLQSSSSSSSDEDSEDIVVYDDDSDLDAEDDFEMDLIEECQAQPTGVKIADLALGDFCLTKLIGKKIHFYVAEVTALSPCLMVQYLKRILSSNKFSGPSGQQFQIDIEDVLLKLEPPRQAGMSERQKGIHIFDLDFEKYNVE